MHRTFRLRRPLALAMALLPGFALGTEVQLYGYLNTAVEVYDKQDSANSSAVALPGTTTARLTNYGSFFGLRGQEDLGGGLKALFQIESYVFIDGVSPPGFNALASRNTRVGLETPYGTVFGGVWDTPMRMLLARDPFPGTVSDGGQLLGNGVANTVSNVQAPASFERRQVNSLAYWSPLVGGLRVMAHHSFAEDSTPTTRPRLWSVSATYDQGPLSLGAAVETHGRYGGPGTGDRAWLLYGAYSVGDLRLAATLVDKRYERTLGAATLDLDLRGWQLQATYRLGQGTVRAAYTRAGDGSGSLSALGTDANGRTVVDAARMVGQATAGPATGAAQLALGYEHAFSKRTAWYANLLLHRNDRNGAYAPFAGVPSPAGALGVDTRMLATGLRHVF